MAEVRLTPAAERDLEKIWLYTQQQWSVEQAERYNTMLVAAFEELAQAPKTAPACDDIRLGYRRRRLEQHVIYFKITHYGIAVVRVLHDRMEPLRRL